METTYTSLHGIGNPQQKCMHEFVLHQIEQYMCHVSLKSLVLIILLEIIYKEIVGFYLTVHIGIYF